MRLSRGLWIPPWASHLQGCSAVICMPTSTPDIKVKAVAALGGTVELVGESYQEAQAHAQVWYSWRWARGKS